jgi:hypothetical protein
MLMKNAMISSVKHNYLSWILRFSEQWLQRGLPSEIVTLTSWGNISPPSSHSKSRPGKKTNLACCYLLHHSILLGVLFWYLRCRCMLFQHIRWFSSDYTALFPRRPNSSITFTHIQVTYNTRKSDDLATK